MEHVVFFPGPDGAPGFRRFPSIEDAVAFVEHLRNVEGVSEVSVHALTPVPLAFRAYYRVEVPAEQLAPAAPPVPAAPPAPPVAAEPVDPVVFEPLPEPVDAVAELVAEPVSEPVEPAAEPVAEVAHGELVEAAAADPSSNGKRSLGFFAH